MNPSLEGYAAAVLGAPDADVGGLADELRAIDELFGANPALRAALTDTAVAAPSRRAVLEALLAGKVSARAQRAAGFAAAAVPAQDVPAAIGWLSRRAHHAAQGEVVVESMLGHLAARQRVGGFAAFVLEGLPAEALEEVEDEIFRFARTVDSTPPLRRALTDRDLALAARRGVVDQLLVGKASETTVRLVDYVVEGGRARDTVGTLDWLVEETARARGWRVARVRSALEIDEPQRQALGASLAQLAGGPVELQISEDPTLLAGLVVRIGDLQVDASAQGRLHELREHMSVAGWERTGFGQAAQGMHTHPEGAE